MTNGATYYAQINSGCNQSGCYDGYSSPNAEFQGVTVGPKDLIFDSAGATLSGVVTGTGGIPLANASVTIKSPVIETKIWIIGADESDTLPALPKGTFKIPAEDLGDTHRIPFGAQLKLFQRR